MAKRRISSPAPALVSFPMSTPGGERWLDPGRGEGGTLAGEHRRLGGGDLEACLVQVSSKGRITCRSSSSRQRPTRGPDADANRE
jgi:hypothetical protein